MLTVGKSYIYPNDFNFPVRTDYIILLGIAIGNDKKQIDYENWEDKVHSCISTLHRWKFRKLSFKGKALVVNSLVISRLNYLVSILPVPDWVFSAIRKAVSEFFWSGKKPAIKYTNLLLPIEKGGLTLCDLEIRRDSFRTKLVAKLLGGKLNNKLRSLMLYFLNQYENMQLGLSIFHICCQRKSLVGIHLFYCEMLLSWNRLSQGRFVLPHDREDILFLPIFHNPLIRDVNGDTLFNRHFIDGGIVRISDLMYEVIPNQLPAVAVHECISFCNPDNPISVEAVEDYIAIVIKALPERWITEIYSSDRVVSSQVDYDPSINFYSGGVVVNASELTCKRVSQLVRIRIESVPKGVTHWMTIFPNLTSYYNRWKNIYRMPKNFYDADIDFKIFHNILYTNDKLHKFGMIDSPLCSFCGRVNETIHHMLLDCSKIEALLEDLTSKLNHVININDINQWRLAVMFGLGYNYKRNDAVLIDFVLNIYKCVVWNCRMSKVMNNYNLNIVKFFHNTMKMKLNLIFQVYRNNRRLKNFFEIFGIYGVVLSANGNNSYTYHLDRG